MCIRDSVKANATFAQIAGNIDLAPTFLAVALGGTGGGSGSGNAGELVRAIDSMDGRSLLPLLHARTGAAGISTDSNHGGTSTNTATNGTWRTDYLIEYYPIANWLPDWTPGKYNISRIDDSPNNTYRAIRIFDPSPELELNSNRSDDSEAVAPGGSTSSHDHVPAPLSASLRLPSGNLLYAETTTLPDGWAFAHPNSFELYDVSQDPHQLTNIHAQQPLEVQQALHTRLDQLWRCQGSGC